MAHKYKKEIAVAIIFLKVSLSPLPTHWDTRIETPVPRPRKMQRSISTGCELVPTAAREREPQKLPITNVSTVL